MLELYWHKKAVVFLAPIISFIASITFFYSSQTQRVSIFGWILSAVVGIIVLCIWFLTNRLPRVAKGNVGIVIGIICDSPEEDKQIKADFVERLRELIQQGEGNFQLLELPSWSLRNIGDAGIVSDYLNRTKGHFMLYGRVRKRNVDGREAHFLNFEGAVRHGPVSAEIQRDLNVDFTNTFPRRVIIGVENDVFQFEATSEWTELCTRYIVGMAAFISGDGLYAEKMLLYVESKLRQQKSTVAGIQEIARRLPERFEKLYSVWLFHLHQYYFGTHERKYVAKADEISTKLLARNPRNLQAMTYKAICEFVLRRDVPAAHKLITKCRNNSDSTWWFSRGFLHVYQGKMEEAVSDYRRAFAGPIQDVTVPVQTEEFIQIILAEEPDRVQLHFCLGLINFYAKSDYIAAQRDFKNFISKVKDDQFPSQVTTARELIDECKKGEAFATPS